MAVATSTAPMTLQEARATIWPFRDFKGQAMGSLVDQGVLSVKDLGFAVERAYDDRVRRASHTLILHQLAQKASQPPIGPLNTIATDRRSYAQRRQIMLFTNIGFFIGIIMGAWGLLLLQSLLNQLSAAAAQEVGHSSLQQPTFIIAILLVIGSTTLIIYAMNWIFNRFERQIKLHRKGELGEERVVNVLHHALDGHWWLFRNLELPGRKVSDFDLVLVGPPGIWLLEVKALGGEYRNTGDRWETLWKGRWIKSFADPSRQARRNAAMLSQALKGKQTSQWVNAVLVWANPESKLTVDYPSVPVWELDQVAAQLAAIRSEKPMSQAAYQQIVAVLKDLAQRQEDEAPA